MNRKATLAPPHAAPVSTNGSLPVIGIGASAGGLDAVKRLFGSLPEKTGMAFVVVMHFSPEHASHLDSILATVTSMPVQQVRGETAIAPDHVYTIAPGMYLSAADGKLLVQRIALPHGVNLEIDRFFHTLAIAHGERAYGVTRSGMGSRSLAGLRRIKEFGGVSVVQHPLDAKFPSMAEHAIAAGGADFALFATEPGVRSASGCRN